LSRTLPGSDWEKQLPFLAYWLIQDWSLSYAASCPECEDSYGVPIARIMLRKYDDRGSKRCCIAYVDETPPYRRRLWPHSLPEEAISLVPYLWRTREQAQASLDRMGIRVERIDPLIIDLNGLRDEFRMATFYTTPGIEVVARTVLFNGQQRIALFRKRSNL
jgi:hypothetical protein